jgi:hypothetical protein
LFNPSAEVKLKRQRTLKQVEELKPSADIDNLPQTHTDLNENLATDIVRGGVKDDFDRLDCLAEELP